MCWGADHSIRKEMSSSQVGWPLGRVFRLESGFIHAAQKPRLKNKDLSKTGRI